MKKDLKLAIYMDGNCSKIFECDNQPKYMTTINVGSVQLDHQPVLSTKKKEPETKVQKLFEIYSKNLGEIILNFNMIYIFLPSTNKTELLTILKRDDRFDDIKFQLQDTTVLNEVQQIAVIKTIFL